MPSAPGDIRLSTVTGDFNPLLTIHTANSAYLSGAVPLTVTGPM